MAYVPYELMRDTVPNPQLNRIMIQTQPDRDPKSLVQAVRRVLAQRLSDQQYTVVTQRDLLNIVFQILGLLTSLLTGLTSIALIVGESEQHTQSVTVRDLMTGREYALSLESVGTIVEHTQLHRQTDEIAPLSSDPRINPWACP